MATHPDHEKLVLVTGGSGFIAAHCIIQLLEAGYRVRATLRSLSREAEVRAVLRSTILKQFHYQICYNIFPQKK